ncbi:MAG: methionine biosynthesis protein MetW [Deltaproteobacteria bacterium]|nr:methionine biosynthesis protein MetW [Deltaproteobacteria bacterium]
MRYDLKIIESWINPDSKVLGLGCGDGELLYFLKTNKNVLERGIEKSEEQASICISKGLSVIQGDINEEIDGYPDDAFDCVILSQTMQEVYKPYDLLISMLRIGKRAIVSFPNFGHWKIRMQLLFSGYVPITEHLPYTWYTTPNIRVLTLNDFRKFATDVGFEICREININTHSKDMYGKTVNFFPNLRSTYGVYMIKKVEK